MITRKFTYDNVSCEYQILGQGRPLIFFHGGGITSKSYSDLIQKLSENFTVYSPDIPCFGNSTIPSETWTFVEYGQYFSQFINYLKLTDLTVVGHSFGGGVGLETALTNKLVTKLILIDSAGAPMEASKFALYRAIIQKPFQQFIRRNKIIALKISLDCIQNFIIKHLTSLPSCFKIINHSLYHQYEIPKTFNTPTLILWGQDDQIFQGITYAAWFKEQIPNSTTKLIPGDHDWVIFRPELLVQELASSTKK